MLDLYRSICEYILIPLASLLVSTLTLYSGFGLGTMLLPVFALFFPVQVAVAATAVEHGANNTFKIAVVGKHADLGMIFRFGLPAMEALRALNYFKGADFEHLSPEDKDILIQASREVSLGKLKPSPLDHYYLA